MTRRRNLGLNSATTTDKVADSKEDLKLLQHLHCCPGFFCLLSELLLTLLHLFDEVFFLSRGMGPALVFQERATCF